MNICPLIFTEESVSGDRADRNVTRRVEYYKNWWSNKTQLLQEIIYCSGMILGIEFSVERS